MAIKPKSFSLRMEDHDYLESIIRQLGERGATVNASWIALEMMSFGRPFFEKRYNVHFDARYVRRLAWKEDLSADPYKKLDQRYKEFFEPPRRVMRGKNYGKGQKNFFHLPEDIATRKPKNE
jgi:hypothetical protein